MVVAAAFGLAACGGDAVLRCERGGTYTTATETPRIRTPEDLDNLDALREMPLPEPSPRAEQPDEDGCLEAPPMIIGEG